MVIQIIRQTSPNPQTSLSSNQGSSFGNPISGELCAASFAMPGAGIVAFRIVLLAALQSKLRHVTIHFAFELMLTTICVRLLAACKKGAASGSRDRSRTAPSCNPSRNSIAAACCSTLARFDKESSFLRSAGSADRVSMVPNCQLTWILYDL